MHEYGIIGYPLSHSRSPEYFRRKFADNGLAGYYYHTFPIENIVKLHYLIKNHPFLYGLNITSPYKQEIIPHLHKLDEIAAKINAVNVVKVIHKKDTTELVGYNTDAPAFKQALIEKWGTDFKQALIFGSGGAAAAAAYILSEMRISHRIVSRQNGSGFLHYSEITPALLSQYDLLINATPVGMSPLNHEDLPIPYYALNEQHHLFDMIYNPAMTLFLEKGKKQHANIENGKRMFEIQAELSWEIFTSK